MNANELRIGNYAFRDGILVQVDGRSIMDAEAGLVNYEGVPLTEDWLLKFGFEKDVPHWYVLHFAGFRFCISLEYDQTTIISPYLIEMTMPDLKKEVHVLQNWIHALTNQELTLTQ